MTKRSWLECGRAATRAARRADEFRQRPGNTRLPDGHLDSHKMYRETGRICLTSLTRATSARKNGGTRRGDNGGAVHTSSRARLSVAGRCATLDQRARPSRRFVLRERARRARAATPASARIERGTAHRRGPSLTRRETSRTRSTRLPALRVAAGLAPRNMPALRQASRGGRCWA